MHTNKPLSRTKQKTISSVAKDNIWPEGGAEYFDLRFVLVCTRFWEALIFLINPVLFLTQTYPC